MQARKLSVLSCFLILTSFVCNIVSSQPVLKQGPLVPVSFCIDEDENELYLMINEYRQRHALAPIPLSKSLSYVAALHVKDLFFNHPDQGACNFHSWSGNGSWTAFCYPGDESKKNSVWDKPRELTRYPARGYEIVYWENNPLVRDTIIMVWKMEEYFNNFLLNTGKWQGRAWNAIGIAVYENYASAWFGEVADPEGEAYVCGSQPVVIKKESPAVKPADTLKSEKHEKQQVRNQPESPVPGDSTPATYYIIVKTNLKKDAADKFVYVLKSGEYPNAKVLDKDGKLRVSAFESPDKVTVMAKLKEVKKTYKDAWLLKR